MQILKNIITNLAIYFTYVISKIFAKYSKYWLISERGIDARDNGYFFYKYMLENHPEIHVVYAISKNSDDFRKVKLLGGDLVVQDSIRHAIIYFSAEALICTHAAMAKPNYKGLWKFQRQYHLFKSRGKMIMLQHGISKDYMPSLTKEHCNADLFICGAKPEYNYVKENFGYNINEVKYTGFARYDTLESNRNQYKRYILVMPTWRRIMWTYKSNKEFIDSTYYKTYYSLLNNTKLISYLERNHIELIFYPHIEVQKWLAYFNTSCKNIHIYGMKDADVQELLINCSLLITDYSSVFFDVAYMKKNILFYQFDYPEYRACHYEEGYFNYQDGLGDVYDNEVDLVEEIINIYGKPLKHKYENKINKFFTYHDDHNCDRIYAAIKETLKK